MFLKVCTSSFFFTSLVVGASCPDGWDSCAASSTHGGALLQKGAMLNGGHIHHDGSTAITFDGKFTGLAHHLALLAGDGGQQFIGLLDKNLGGWERGRVIEFVDPRGQTNGKSWTDTVKLFSKGHGGTKKCAVVFSASDDTYDYMQAFKGSTEAGIDFCGHPAINSGYVEEFNDIFQNHGGEWDSAMDELKGCSETWAVGHSMGGALASIFAFCVNSNTKHNQRDYFGPIRTKAEKVKLFLIAPATAAKEPPLYNGDSGVCFEGLRVQSYVEMKAAKPKLYIAVAEWFETILNAVITGFMSISNDPNTPPTTVSQLLQELTRKQAELTALQGFTQQMRDTNDASTFQTNVVPTLPFDVIIPIMEDLPIPNLEFLQSQYSAFQAAFKQLAITHADMLAIPYDPAPYALYHNGWLHPMVSAETVPIGKFAPHHNGTRTNCVEGDPAISKIPNPDQVQMYFGGVALDMPHHGICCLYDDPDNCGKLFNPSAGVKVDDETYGFGVHCNADENPYHPLWAKIAGAVQP